MNSTSNIAARVPLESREWNVLMWSGALIALLGLVAVAFPFVTGISISIALGALLVVGGLVHVAHAFAGRGLQSFLYQALLGIIYAVAGVSLLANPVVGLASLTVLLAAFLVADAVVEIAVGLRMRSADATWGWYVVSGALGLLVAGLIWIGWPASAAWAIGLLLGANLFTTGVAMIFVSRAGRRAMDRDAPIGAEHARGA